MINRKREEYGLFNEQTNEVVQTSPEQDGAVNLAEKAVVKTLQAGGDVFVVDPEQMPDGAAMAAIFRY